MTTLEDFHINDNNNNSSSGNFHINDNNNNSSSGNSRKVIVIII
jgi:hypothetical protein